jgi:hypothetical protein
MAMAARVLHEISPDRAYLERIYPATVRYHEWLHATRDPDDVGLVTVVHPWECGSDNSPAYDAIRDDFVASGLGVDPPARADTKHVAAEQRPRADDYQFYWGLIAQFQKLGWSQRDMARRSPCRVADVAVNSLWARANADLAALARELGRVDDARRFDTWAEETRRALVGTCWSADDSFFYSYDQARGEPIRIRTVAGFLPLVCGAASGEMASALVDALRDRRRFGGGAGVPSTAFDEPCFDPRNYWRGPAWINMHWLIADGLRRYGYFDTADELAARSIDLVERQGYREYYDTLTGEGLGAADFCWSALAHDMPAPRPSEVFQRPQLAIGASEIEAHAELQTLYDHPDAREVAPDDVVVTSTPRVLVDRLLADVPGAVAGQGGSDLDAVAASLGELLERHRPPGDDYPRRCDVAVLAVSRAARELGLDCAIMWSPDLHYYGRIRARDGGDHVVDLVPGQFARHPASRLPLVIETITLSLLRRAEDGWLAAEAVLRHGRTTLGSELAGRPAVHLAAAEREAFAKVCARHREVVERVASARGPRAADDYLRWFDRVVAPLERATA